MGNKYHIVRDSEFGNEFTVLEFDEDLSYVRSLVGYRNFKNGTYKLYDRNYHGYAKKYVKEIGLIDLVPWGKLSQLSGVPDSYAGYFKEKGINVG